MDILSLPTRGDFSPTNAVCEAMAAGLPVIATGVGGLDEIVQHDRTGCLIGVDNEEALATAIERLQEDEKLRQRLRTNARQLIEEKYNLWHNASKMIEYMKQTSHRHFI